MTSFVVDPSVAIKWVVDETGAELATRLLDHQLAAPDLLCPECANILWKKVMRGELSAPEAEAAAGALETVDISLHPMRRQLRAAVALASALRHPAYDCIYLSLAEALGQPLITADDRLVGVVRASVAKRVAELVVPLAELPTFLADDRVRGS